jgi:hypothetical protein
MMIQSHLFQKGLMTRQPSLADILLGHEIQTLNTIKDISSLDEMTDSFLSSLVKDSLVDPLVIHLDRITRQLRTEHFDGSEFPFDFNVRQGRKYPKTVARISVPFSGDSQPLSFTPNECSLNFPQGEVCGKAIQFDVILWGYEDDERRVTEQVELNLGLLKEYSGNVARQINAFNEALPEKVKTAFNSKLESLTKQHSIFDRLGIMEEKQVPVASPSEQPAPKPSRERSRAVHIIQYVERQYVQQLNQTNTNIGDVNNAIQSN